MVTRHGRATPLVWKTVRSSKLKNRRAGYEDNALETLAEAVPKGTRVTVLADRGFGDQKRYAHVLSLGFHYVIRFRQGILLTDEFGESAPAVQWLHPRGRARMLKQVAVTTDCYLPPAIVLVRAKKMKEAWCLATSRDDVPADEVVRLYGKRFSIEETFRDQKDRRFGLGLYYTKLGDPGRRDRMLLVLTLAHLIATLLGAAGEGIGLDRLLRANTVKTRTHSLFRQGYEYLRGVIDRMLAPLRAAFFELLRGYVQNAQVFAEIGGDDSGPHHMPGRERRVRPREHLVAGFAVLLPVLYGRLVDRAHLPLLERIASAVREATLLLGLADVQIVLSQQDPGAYQELLEARRVLHERFVLFGRAKPHHDLDPRAVVPAAVEDHDLAPHRQMRHVPLKVPARFVAIGGLAQCHDARLARAEILDDSLDRAVLAGAVAAFEHDEDPQALADDLVL
jgi:hypothetical protein